MNAASLLLDVAVADYDDPADAIAVVALLDEYARDPMGGGEPLATVTAKADGWRGLPMAGGCWQSH